MTDFYKEPAFWAYFAAWLPYVLIIVVYGFGSPWYRSAIGRSLMLTKVAIVFVLTNVLAAYIFGEYPWRDAVRVLLIGCVVGAGVYQLATIIREQRVPVGQHPMRRCTDRPQDRL